MHATVHVNMSRALQHCLALQHTDPGLMQGHALFARHAGSTLPCPYVDYEAGFNGILAGAYGLGPGETIEKLFGKKWDPYVNDATYTISMLTLEELGATGNKVGTCTVPATHLCMLCAKARAFCMSHALAVDTPRMAAIWTCLAILQGCFIWLMSSQLSCFRQIPP